MQEWEKWEPINPDLMFTSPYRFWRDDTILLMRWMRAYSPNMTGLLESRGPGEDRCATGVQF